MKWITLQFKGSLTTHTEVYGNRKEFAGLKQSCPNISLIDFVSLFWEVISLKVISHTEFVTTNCSSVQYVVNITDTAYLNSVCKANKTASVV